MVTSGWQIYNASPLFPFRFPREITLGGWLAGGIQWHFAAMWLLVLNGTVYVTYGSSRGTSAGSFFRSPLPPCVSRCEGKRCAASSRTTSSMYKRGAAPPPTSRSSWCLISAGVHRPGDLEAGAVLRDRAVSSATTRRAPAALLRDGADGVPSCSSTSRWSSSCRAPSQR